MVNSKRNFLGVERIQVVITFTYIFFNVKDFQIKFILLTFYVKKILHLRGKIDNKIVNY